jgi:hypothetical protein
LAKQTRQPFPDGESKTTGVLEIVHMDVCGPLEKRSKGGSRFFATFTDDYSKLSGAIPIEKKSQVVDVVRNCWKSALMRSVIHTNSSSTSPIASI